ncbi:hypothetical protein HYE82_15530 [Streptomyces sp. BR123]|uniref:hypothetical protein n=1 Tax=Streptomyces sp. BR123 TaxID=2749828 RepID=UPI0015C4376D|nr:hypothetical protein [Streptomyces sp. BR123]NXY95776.1 hypothetical protein [Streptomyces sp. BR123]
MDLPAPRLRRLVRLIAIDSDELIALVHPTPPRPQAWALPEREVPLHGSYARTASSLALDLMGASKIRWGTVTGRRLGNRDAGRRTEVHYFIARTDFPPTNRSLMWISRLHLNSHLTGQLLQDTSNLTDGYLDGWLPDGPITLE